MNTYLKGACAVFLAFLLMPMLVCAAGFGDTFPEGFSFWAESAGEKYIVENDPIPQIPKDYGKTKTAEDIATFVDEMFRLVNEQRVGRGLFEVNRCAEMDAVATIRAKEMSEFWGHYRPDGTWYTTLADEMGIAYKYIGENAAKNGAAASPSDHITGWMNSDDHSANILREKHTKVGIGVYYIGQYVYVSLMLYY